MINKIKPINYSDKICFKCLKEEGNINKYTIAYRGYGSIFDSFNSLLQLCDDCNHEDIKLWFDESPEMTDECWEQYKYEDNIWDFVQALPLQGRELFENQCADGAGCRPMDSQDWIDIELNIAPDSLYKEYGMYSPSEIKAYKDRFPTCANVYLKRYKDGSCCCKCDRGAFGNADGSCGLNVSNECYTCRNYLKKGFDLLLREEEELSIDPSKLKKIEMYEWTCEVCGEIVHTHTYRDDFVCPKCKQWYDVEYEQVYCTECIHFKLSKEDAPYCANEEKCDIFDCESSVSIKYRPFYKYFKEDKIK